MSGTVPALFAAGLLIASAIVVVTVIRIEFGTSEREAGE